MGQKINPKAFRLITTQSHLSNWYSNKINYAIYSKEDFFIRKEICKILKPILHLAEIQINRQNKIETDRVTITIKALALQNDQLDSIIDDKITEFINNDQNLLFESKTFKNAKFKLIYNNQIQTIINLKKKNLKKENEYKINPFQNNEINKFLSKYNSKKEIFSKKERKSELFPLISFLRYNKKKGANLILKEKIKKLICTFEKLYKRNYRLKILWTQKKNLFKNAALIARFICILLEKRVAYKRIFSLILLKAPLVKIEGIKIQLSGRLNGADMARSEWRRVGKVPLHTLRVELDYAQDIAKTADGVLGTKVWLHKKYVKPKKKVLGTKTWLHKKYVKPKKNVLGTKIWLHKKYVKPKKNKI